MARLVPYNAIMDVVTPQPLAPAAPVGRPARVIRWYRRHMWTATTALVLLVLAVGFAALQVTTHGRIGTGVRVGGIDVSGLTPANAEARLTERLLPTVSPVKLLTAERTLKSSLADLGFTVDTAASARKAFALGRREIAGFTVWLPLGGGEAAPVLHLDPEAFARSMEPVRQDVDVPARDARLRMDGKEIAVVPAADGSAVDEAALARAIRASVAAGRPFEGKVPTKAVRPQVSTAQARSSASAARVYAAAPITLRLRELSVVLPPDEITGLLSVATGAAAADRPLTFDNARARARLRVLLAPGETPPVDALVTPLAGGGVSVTQSREGTAVDMDRLVADLDEAAAGGGLRSVHVTTLTVAPKLSTAEFQASGLSTLGSQFVTYFDPRNTARATNIAVAADLVDGAVVRSGAVFSLNAAMGPRTVNRGFDYAPVIAADNVLRQGVGGGICQYATTLFNAVFFAGLPVAERHSHSLFIDHYPIGRDATVAWGSADFKFRNDTGKPLTIRSWVQNGALTVAVVGKTGREVESTTSDFYDVRKPEHGKNDPRVVQDSDLAAGITRWERGVEGLSVKVTRTVRSAAGAVLFKDSFTSTYRPMDWIKRVGTG